VAFDTDDQLTVILLDEDAVAVTPVGALGGFSAKFAVTVTALAGMVNEVDELLALASVTQPLVTVQPVNCCPDGGVPAEI
jgi:hypothetical protein